MVTCGQTLTKCCKFLLRMLLIKSTEGHFSCTALLGNTASLHVLHLLVWFSAADQLEFMRERIGSLKWLYLLTCCWLS